eukprot:TRINITY_DN59248_c0_g1_i1.p1 TRINITY_DN59248_c0_g1~~TRINITY_DN59248_c0_g1_i1.p1  ORF type:complete len:133 (-),score=17.00 TRINITY_DN59248_c0_g1_i1:10-408(-)
MIDTVFGFLNNLDKVIPELQQLGKRHAAYGAELDHFTAVGDTLLWVLETEEEPGQWNEGLATAWGNLYQIVGGVMAEAMLVAKLTSKTSNRRSAHFTYHVKKRKSSRSSQIVQIGRAVQQECRDRSRMPSSA